MSTNERPTQIAAADAYWVETPWRSWGVVYGATPEQARENAILDREQEILRVYAWIERVKRMPIDVQCEEGGSDGE